MSDAESRRRSKAAALFIAFHMFSGDIHRMTPAKSRRLARKSALRQQELVESLESLAKSIGRADTMIIELKDQMEAVNAKHANRKTTADDIDYLEDLLRCARKKLAWEQQMAKLSKRIPEVLEEVSAVMNDPVAPPADETRVVVVQLLQNVQQSMARLEQAKGD